MQNVSYHPEFPDLYIVKKLKIPPDRIVFVTGTLSFPQFPKGLFHVLSSTRMNSVRIGRLYVCYNTLFDFLMKFSLSSDTSMWRFSTWTITYRDLLVAYKLFQKNPVAFREMVTSVDTIEDFVALALIVESS